MNKYRFAPWLVFFAALLWAVDAPFRVFLTGDLSSGTIVLMEHILIAILVLPFLIKGFSELKQLGVKEWFAAIFIALAGSVLAIYFFTESFRFINPSVTILLQKTQPIIAIIFAWIFLHEKLSRHFIIWALLAILGAYLITFPEIRIDGFAFEGSLLGVVYALLAAFLWGVSTVAGRYLSDKASFKTITGLRFGFGLVILLIWQGYLGRLGDVGLASSKDWLFVFIIAVLAGFVSLLIYYKGLSATKASVATIAELAFPFSAVVINWIFLDASLDIIQIVGGLILLLAVVNLSRLNEQELAPLDEPV